MTESPERYKVAYRLHFPREHLSSLGSLCVDLNLEVLHTNAPGDEVVMLVRMAPEDEGPAAERLAATVSYESPAKVSRGVLVPLYGSPAEEIAARQERASTLRARQVRKGP